MNSIFSSYYPTCIKDESLLPPEQLNDMLRARAFLLDKSYETEKMMNDFTNNMKDYFNVLNNPKSTIDEMDEVFELIFHDDFTAKLEGGGFGGVESPTDAPLSLDKAQVKAIKEDEFEKRETGKPVALVKLQVLDKDHVEGAIVKGDEWRRHQLLTLKEGKVVSLETMFDIDDLVYNLNHYIKVQNNPDSTVEDMNKAFDNNFHDDLVADVANYPSGLTKDDARKIVMHDFAAKAILSFDQIVKIDSSHLDIIISKKGDWTRHQILTVNDGKIINIDTVNGSTDEGGIVKAFDVQQSYPVSAQ